MPRPFSGGHFDQRQNLNADPLPGLRSAAVQLKMTKAIKHESADS